MRSGASSPSEANPGEKPVAFGPVDADDWFCFIQRLTPFMLKMDRESSRGNRNHTMEADGTWKRMVSARHVDGRCGLTSIRNLCGRSIRRPLTTKRCRHPHHRAWESSKIPTTPISHGEDGLPGWNRSTLPPGECHEGFNPKKTGHAERGFIYVRRIATACTGTRRSSDGMRNIS